ncbi:MAG: hypothetical protein WBM02_08985 [bacterium]
MKSIHFLVLAINFSTLMCHSAFAFVLPSTVTTEQWQDSYMAKWQSGNEGDKVDAIEQLAALLLLLPPSDSMGSITSESLERFIQISPDALMAQAFYSLQSGNPKIASQRLLDIILKYPDEPRINRFRIALARAFREEGKYDLAAAQLDPLMNLITTDGKWATLEKVDLLHKTGDFKGAVQILKLLAPAVEGSGYFEYRVKQALAAAGTEHMLRLQMETE